jgi:hypothetical protein
VRWRRWWAGRSARTRRWVRVVAAVAGIAVVLALLRAGTAGSPGPVRAAGSSAPAAPTPTPPFDRLPGRTPIPEPAQTGDALSGPLPPTGPLGKAAAGRAADLVLGRYCAHPRTYTYTLGADSNGRAQDWHHVDVLVFSLLQGGTGPALRFFLDWDGTAYRWLGFLALLDGC